MHTFLNRRFFFTSFFCFFVNLHEILYLLYWQFCLLCRCFSWCLFYTKLPIQTELKRGCFFFFFPHTHTHRALIVSCVGCVLQTGLLFRMKSACEEGQRRRITNDYCCWLSSLLEHWILMWRPSVWLTWMFYCLFLSHLKQQQRQRLNLMW